MNARVGANKDGAPAEKFRRSGWFTTRLRTTNLSGVSRSELEDEEGREGDAATEMVFVTTPATAGRSMRGAAGHSQCKISIAKTKVLHHVNLPRCSDD
jgi:hypothetical protein